MENGNIVQNGDVTEELDALIVGSGFGGIWLLYHLRKLGMKVKIYEGGQDLGGVCNPYLGRFGHARNAQVSPPNAVFSVGTILWAP